jgi:predicted transcriptional regulator
MMELVELLQQLGFSEYEARAYIHLLQHHPANGYALAKASGIPRANIYSVLKKLEGRGAIISVETASGNSYTPVPAAELIRHLSERYQGVLQTTQQLLEQIAPPPDSVFVQNIEGYPQVMEHARELLNRASHQLTLAVWQPEAHALASLMAKAEARGVSLTVLCLQACPEECGGCRDNVYRYRITPNHTPHQLIVIADGAEMLMGTTGAQTVAIRTRQPNLIESTDSYIRHSIALAAILTDVGGEFEQALNPETQKVLLAIGQGHSWLQRLMHLLKN